MTETVSDERRAIAKAIMMQVQCHDFGTKLPNGDFRCSSAQIDELERCCNAAADSILALRTPPQNTDGEAVAWRYTTRDINGDEWPWTYTEHKPVQSGGTIIEALVPASALSAMKAERDALIASTGEHITKRSEYLARAEAAESDLTRYIDIATKEATEAESLREALAQSDADATAARIAIDRLTSERDALIASTGEHITKRSEYLARAERAEAERDALAKALEPFAKAADVKLCGHFEDHQYFGQTDVGFYLTFGDLRRARSTLQGDAK